jgi:hypothetical protein
MSSNTDRAAFDKWVDQNQTMDGRVELTVYDGWKQGMQQFEPSGVWRYRCREFNGWGRWMTGSITEVHTKVLARSAYHVEAYELYRPVTVVRLSGPTLSEALAEKIPGSLV